MKPIIPLLLFILLLQLGCNSLPAIKVSSSSEPIKIDAPIIVHFDKQIDARTINATTVTLSSYNRYGIQGKIILEGLNLYFYPSLPLVYGSNYTLSLSKNISTEEGNQLEVDYKIPVTVQDKPKNEVITLITPEESKSNYSYSGYSNYYENEAVFISLKSIESYRFINKQEAATGCYFVSFIFAIKNKTARPIEWARVVPKYIYLVDNTENGYQYREITTSSYFYSNHGWKQSNYSNLGSFELRHHVVTFELPSKIIDTNFLTLDTFISLFEGKRYFYINPIQNKDPNN